MKIPNLTVKILSTVFYLGYLPLIPGTFGSLAGLFLFYFVKGSSFAQISLILALLVLGFLITGRAEKLFGRKDPGCIVIDEVCGMLLSLIFIPYDIKLVVIAFILFRILDTLKPFPAGRVQELHGSIGIMGDDIIAGLYANVVLQLALRMISFKGS